MKAVYTIPKVVKYDDLSKPWYVYFRYNGKKFVYKKGINYYSTFKEIEKEANILAEALLKRLKDNWNPAVPICQILMEMPLTLLWKREFQISAQTQRTIITLKSSMQRQQSTA